MVNLGDTVLLLPSTKQWTRGVLVPLATPEAVSIGAHLAAWVAQYPRTWHAKGVDILAHTPLQQAIPYQALHDQHQQSDHHKDLHQVHHV